MIGRPIPRNFSTEYLNYFLESTLIDGSSDPTDAFFTLMENNVSKKIGAVDILEFIGAKTAQVNLTSSMSLAEMQSIISAVSSYIPYGVGLDLKFQETSITMSGNLTISGFFGGGVLSIIGENSTTLKTTQATILDFESAGGIGMTTDRNQCTIVVKGIKVLVADAQIAWLHNYSVSELNMQGCYLGVDGTSSGGTCILAQRGANVDLRNNYFSGSQFAVSANINTGIYSVNNDDDGSGVTPLYGLRSGGGSIISKNGTQPNGSTSAESTVAGGQIL